MKRLLFLLAILLPLAAEAGPVSESKAKALAGKFFEANGRPAGAKLVRPAQTKGFSLTDPFFIFNHEGGGFVIMASNDAINPIIGWSPTGEFKTKDMPENARKVFETWADITEAANDGRITATEEIEAEWANLEAGLQQNASGGGKLLKTAEWGQSAPYNRYCPNFSGTTCFTGCVATALGIIMYYYKYPKAGTGTLESYKYTDKEDGTTTRNISGYSLGHEYRWDLMTDKYDDKSSEESKNAVATLLHDLGVMFKASYGTTGTGAYQESAEEAAKKYMGYDASAGTLYKKYFSNKEWIDKIKYDIDNVGPVFYGAENKNNGGHQFVIDGYDSSDRFHINFGWNGQDNAYFTFPGFLDYTEFHSAAFGLKPDAGGKAKVCLVLDSYASNNGEVWPAIECSIDRITKGAIFDISATIQNLSITTFDGRIAVVIAGKDGTIRDTVCTLETTLPGWTLIYEKFEECVITGKIQEGDRLQIASKSQDETEWTLLRGNIESGEKYYIELEANTGIDINSSFRFNAGSGELLISTLKDAAWSITSSAGVRQTEGATFSAGVLTIDTTKFPPDTYTVTLSIEEESKVVKFKFGSK